jgi:hypothetical protein
MKIRSDIDETRESMLDLFYFFEKKFFFLKIESNKIPIIIGISIGSILLLLVLAIIIAMIIFFKRRKMKPDKKQSTEKLPNE